MSVYLRLLGESHAIDVLCKLSDQDLIFEIRETILVSHLLHFHKYIYLYLRLTRRHGARILFIVLTRHHRRVAVAVPSPPCPHLPSSPARAQTEEG